MKSFRTHLEKIRAIKRKSYHHLLHKVHKKHKISGKTLFYIKEYGPHANIPKTIIKESIKILLFASIISSFGGVALEHVKTVFISIMPLIILLPTLNDMIGNYGAVVSSRFSTMLHEGNFKREWRADDELRKLFMQTLIIATLTAGFGSLMALVISALSGYVIGAGFISKIFFISIVDVALLVSIIFLTSIFAGLYFYKKKEDPNNFLIPIATSLADFGNMIILSILIILLF